MPSAVSINVRRLSPADLDLAEIVTRLNESDSDVADNFSTESLRAFIADPKRFYLIAAIDEQLAGAVHGYALLHPSGITNLYIDEVDTMVGFRRRGVARAMMKEAFEIGRKYGATDAWLGTEHDNVAAKALYLSFNPTETDNGPIYTWRLN